MQKADEMRGDFHAKWGGLSTKAEGICTEVGGGTKKKGGEKGNRGSQDTGKKRHAVNERRNTAVQKATLVLHVMYSSKGPNVFYRDNTGGGEGGWRRTS